MARPKKNSRAKGKRGEREIAKLLSEWWGSEFTSTPLSGGFSTKTFRDDWNAAGDVVTPDKSFPFVVEVKNCEGWNLEQLLTSPKCDLFSWWNQAVEETSDGKITLLLFSRNFQPWFFAMWESDFRINFFDNAPVHVRLVHPGYGQPIVIGLAEVIFATPPEKWKR